MLFCIWRLDGLRTNISVDLLIILQSRNTLRIVQCIWFNKKSYWIVIWNIKCFDTSVRSGTCMLYFKHFTLQYTALHFPFGHNRSCEHLMSSLSQNWHSYILEHWKLQTHHQIVWSILFSSHSIQVGHFQARNGQICNMSRVWLMS